MKTKITLRTKIALTMLGLLAVAGAFYAANPTSFAPVPDPIGVAAAPDLLLVTENCSQDVDAIDCSGTASVFASIPGNGGCTEKYLAIAPSQSANAGFTPRDIFVTRGAEIYKVDPSGSPPHSATLFATITGAPDDHTGITFDHVGTFGWNMIVTTSDPNGFTNGGKVYRVDGNGNSTLIADTGMQTIQGPAVVPMSFGPPPGDGRYGGMILVADVFGGTVHAIASDGTVNYAVFNLYGANAVVVIPSASCKFCSNIANFGAYFQAIESFGAIYQYPPDDFNGLNGGVLVTSEFGAGSNSITWDGSMYNENPFDNIGPGSIYTGSAWTDCDVPTATPAPCQVTSAACDSVITGNGPTDFIVNVSDPVDPLTVQPTDFTVNGIAADAFDLQNGNMTIVFHFNTTPVTQGLNTMHIPAGAFNCVNGTVPEFTCTFTQQGSTPTPTPTTTATATATATATFTPTPESTATATATFTPTPEPTATATATFTPVPTATFTPVPTATFTPVPTATFTPVPTATFTPVPTATFTPVPTATFTPVPTATSTPTATTTATATATATATPTSTPGPPCVSTAGYWANHGWCVQTMQLQCHTYTQAEAIAIINNSTSGDKTYSLAAQLFAAKLNINCAGANSSCVAAAIASADAWLCDHPVGSGVDSNSAAWKQVKAAYVTMTDYNEGRLCVPKCRS